MSLAQKGIVLSSLLAVMHSPDWIVYGTAEDKIYFVNTQTQGLQLTVLFLCSALFNIIFQLDKNTATFNNQCVIYHILICYTVIFYMSTLFSLDL